MFNSKFADKDVIKAVAQAMNKTERTLFKNHKATAFVFVERKGKALKRWGKNVYFTLTSPCGTVGQNSLVGSAWHWDEEDAWQEAKNALSYFVHGNRDEYTISVTVLPDEYSGWETPMSKEEALPLIEEAGSFCDETAGGFTLTYNATYRGILWEEEGGYVRVDLDKCKEQHCCYNGIWTSWQ